MLSDRDYMHGGRRRGYAHHPMGRGAASASVVWPLILANIAVFILTAAGTNRLTATLALIPAGLRQWQLWRLGTYMFVHGGFVHILFNMWGLFLFGKPVEDRIGPGRFLQLYFISGLIGGGCWLLLNWNSPTLVIGASGAVFGVMMAAAMMYPNMQIMLLFPPIPMRLKTFVAVYAGLEVMMELSGSQGGIAHIAHLGGLFGAFVYMRWLSRGPAPFASDRGIRAWWRRLRARFQPSPPRTPPESGSGPDDGTGPAGAPPPPRSGGGESVLGPEVDRILDKIGREGIASLSREERETLARARERLIQGRNGR